MSRIGKKIISLPAGVNIKIHDDQITVKGPKGELMQKTTPEVKLELKDNEVIVTPAKKSKKTQAQWGLFRALVNNMIFGVTQGYEKRLEIEGIGFRAELKGKDLSLNIGLSHSVIIPAPPGIEFKVEKNIIIISGFDKYLVGQIAAKIRAKKKPEPYKGKGIKYVGEVLRRKAGKKTAT